MSFTAFDPEAEHCGGVYPPDKDGDNASCFRHSWETAEARELLWTTVEQEGREVKRLLLSDVNNRIRYGGYNVNGVCDPDLVTLLEEAHFRGVEVYGLYSISDEAFTEQYRVNRLNVFNQKCGTKKAYFDGAAVNNEHFTKVKDCDGTNDAAQVAFLDNLQAAAYAAAPLPFHFSVAWNWWCCDCSAGVERMIEWNGSWKNGLEHMIDIVDSVDVQVAWNTGSTMTRRAETAYNYWETTKKDTTASTNFYVLAYTNPNSDCRLSFSPQTKGALTSTDDCSNGADRTEEGMFAAFDEVRASLPAAKGGIHMLGGVYSSGMPGWPKHVSASAQPQVRGGGARH